VASAARAEADRGNLPFATEWLRLVAESTLATASRNRWTTPVSVLCTVCHAQAQLQDWTGALATAARIRLESPASASDSSYVAEKRAAAYAVLASTQAEMGADFSAAVAETGPVLATSVYADAAEAAFATGDTAKARLYLGEARRTLEGLGAAVRLSDRCKAVARVAWAALRVGEAPTADTHVRELGRIVSSASDSDLSYSGEECVTSLVALDGALDRLDEFRALRAKAANEYLSGDLIPEALAAGAMWAHGEAAYWATLARYRFSSEWFSGMGEAAARLAHGRSAEFPSGPPDPKDVPWPLSQGLMKLAFGFALVREQKPRSSLPQPLYISGCR
jgi:hypothetical protein